MFRFNNKRQEAANLLNISINSNENEIKKAYRKASLKWHPDKNINNKEVATEMFKKISEAYKTLLNPEEEIFSNIFKNEPEYFNEDYNIFTEEEQMDMEAEDFFNFLNNVTLQEAMGIPINKNTTQRPLKKEIKKKTLKYRVKIKITDIWLNSIKKLKINNKYLVLPLYYDNIIFNADAKSMYSYIGVQIIDKEYKVDNIVFKRKGNYDIQIVKEIELYKLYTNTIIDIKLPNNNIINIDWNKSYIDNIKNERIKGFYLYDLGLPKPDNSRGKLWVIFSIILPDKIDINIKNNLKTINEINDLRVPEWFDYNDIKDSNMSIKSRHINLKLEDYLR